MGEDGFSIQAFCVYWVQGVNYFGFHILLKTEILQGTKPFFYQCLGNTWPLINVGRKDRRKKHGEEGKKGGRMHSHRSMKNQGLHNIFSCGKSPKYSTKPTDRNDSGGHC